MWLNTRDLENRDNNSYFEVYLSNLYSQREALIPVPKTKNHMLFGTSQAVAYFKYGTVCALCVLL